MPRLQLVETSEVGTASAAVRFDAPWSGTPSTWSVPDLPFLPGSALRGALRGQLQSYFRKATVDFEVADDLLWPGSETVATREEPPRVRRITLTEARGIALSAMEEADERWRQAVQAEAAFFDEVLEGLDEVP